MTTTRSACLLLLALGICVWSDSRVFAEPSTADVPAGNTQLAAEAQKFLSKYCAECHYGADPKSGIKDFDVLDYQSLTKARKKSQKEFQYVSSTARSAAALDASRLWHRAGIEGVSGAEGDMPPEDAAAKPSNAERKDILQKWLEAGAPAWDIKATATKPTTAEEPQEGQLWLEVREIFEQKCMKCHDGPNPQSGVNGLQIVDYRSLTAVHKASDRGDRITEWTRDPWSYIKAGKKGPEALDESLAYYLIKTDKMPRGSEKLSAGEKAILKEWILAGAPTPPAAAPRPKLSLLAQNTALFKHLEAASAQDRPYLRYFSILHLHNNPAVFEKDLKTTRAGLAKLLNSLSWQTELVVPQFVPGTHETLLVVDLRKLGWDPQKTWEEIIKSYPYPYVNDVATEQGLQKLCCSRTPALRADWFVVRCSRPPLYHQLLGLPDTDRELEKKLGVDFAANFRTGNMARAGYLGASTTTSGFRVVERQVIKSHPGAYWKSYDFGSDELARDDHEQRNPLLHGLGPDFQQHPYPEKAFRHDGGEIIFNLPNGLQGYLVVDSGGHRVDAPPIWILKDKNEFAGTPQIVNGISCMACHSQGMQTVSDQVRVLSENGKMTRGSDSTPSRNLIRKMYVPKPTMDNLLQGDQQRFQKAVATVTNPFLTAANGRVEQPKVELIYAVTQRYRQHLNLDDVACELGYDNPETLRSVLKSNPQILKGLGIQFRLMQPGGKISREEWAKAIGTVIALLDKHKPVATSAAIKLKK